jgi:hypothetical protein
VLCSQVAKGAREQGLKGKQAAERDHDASHGQRDHSSDLQQASSDGIGLGTLQLGACKSEPAQAGVRGLWMGGRLASLHGIQPNHQ